VRGALAAGALLACGVAGVGLLQPRLSETAHRVKQSEDVYVLPPPEELKVMSLGYKAALADALWAKLLVDYGMHWFDKRPFTDITKYIDAILALEPDHKLVYRYVDTLLVFRFPQGTREDALLARQYLERGTRERPFDHDVWKEYGEFLAFIGPSFLVSQEERDQWRHDGALAMARAVELGADPERALSAATILNQSGERNAAIAYLQRAYWLTDDPETREFITAKLQRLEATPDDRDVAYIDARWAEWGFRKGRVLMYPALSRGEVLLSGPFVDTAACAGVREPKVECERSWDALLPSSRAK
jgi:hypothetical protein